MEGFDRMGFTIAFMKFSDLDQRSKHFDVSLSAASWLYSLIRINSKNQANAVLASFGTALLPSWAYRRGLSRFMIGPPREGDSHKCDWFLRRWIPCFCSYRSSSELRYHCRRSCVRTTTVCCRLKFQSGHRIEHQLKHVGHYAQFSSDSFRFWSCWLKVVVSLLGRKTLVVRPMIVLAGRPVKGDGPSKTLKVIVYVLLLA